MSDFKKKSEFGGRGLDYWKSREEMVAGCPMARHIEECHAEIDKPHEIKKIDVWKPTIQQSIKAAIEKAIQLNSVVAFGFNGNEVIVAPNSDYDEVFSKWDKFMSDQVDNRRLLSEVVSLKDKLHNADIENKTLQGRLSSIEAIPSLIYGRWLEGHLLDESDEGLYECEYNCGAHGYRFRTNAHGWIFIGKPIHSGIKRFRQIFLPELKQQPKHYKLLVDGTIEQVAKRPNTVAQILELAEELKERETNG